MTKRAANQSSAGRFVRYPRIHQLAFNFAQQGWRGSSYVWWVARRLKSAKSGRNTRLPSGFVLKVNERDWISKTVYEGTYERALLKFLRTLDLEEIVIDIGANIGVTLWYSLAHNSARTTFIAFEPSRGCQEALELVCAELLAKGKLNFFAVGGTNGILPLHGVGNQSHSGSASLLWHSGLSGKEIQVEVRTLDSVLGSDLKGRISLLKIDTEGYESEVVNGATSTLESQQVDIIVMEVSPNFGSIKYLTDLEETLGGEYIWFQLGESGIVKRSPILKTISCTEALIFTSQWNLVLMRKEVFARYKKKDGAIGIQAVA
jgi:FkbM family methyltransferase